MGRAIYKPDPALDEYLIFSTITDGPVSPVMNRKAIAQEWRDSCEAINGEPPRAVVVAAVLVLGCRRTRLPAKHAPRVTV